MAEAVDHFGLDLAHHGCVLIAVFDRYIDRNTVRLQSGCTVNVVLHPTALHAEAEVDSGADIPPDVISDLGTEQAIGRTIAAGELPARAGAAVDETVVESQVAKTDKP